MVDDRLVSHELKLLLAAIWLWESNLCSFLETGQMLIEVILVRLSKNEELQYQSCFLLSNTSRTSNLCILHSHHSIQQTNPNHDWIKWLVMLSSHYSKWSQVPFPTIILRDVIHSCVLVTRCRWCQWCQWCCWCTSRAHFTASFFY